MDSGNHIEKNTEWRGYTLDEIRVRRLVNLTRIEIQQMHLKQCTDKYTSRSGAIKPLSIVGKMFGALDYLDYGILAFRIGRRALSLFRRKK